MNCVINNNVWQIIYVEPNSEFLIKDDGSDYALGVCDNNVKCIYINNSLSDYMQEKVLLHEIVHAFIFEYGLIIDRELEEEICNLFANHGREMISIVDYVFQQMVA